MPESARFEVGLTLPFDISDYLDAAVLIDELGFDYLACGEHVAFHGPVANAFILLSHAAAVTHRVRLLSAITLVSLYPAPLLAKLAAMTDVVSGGRFELGVGVGGEYPAEFAACGVPLNERGARTDEALQIIKALWPGEAVSFQGKFWSFSDISLQPPPFQQPGPRIWVAGRNSAAIRRVALHGDVWMPYMYSPEQFRDSVADIRNIAQAAGRDPNGISASINCFLVVDPDGARARQMAAEKVGRTYQQDFTGSLGRYLIAGTAEECVGRLCEYAVAGAESAILTLACPPLEWSAMARLVAAEVLPKVHGFAKESTSAVVNPSVKPLPRQF